MNKTARATGTGVMIAVVLIIILLIVRAGLNSHSENTLAEQALLEDLRPVKKYVSITTGKWSETIEPKLTHQKRVTAGAIGVDVPYRVAINGGKEHGGITYDVPAWKDWGRLGWKAPELPNTIIEIKFMSLAKRDAQVWCLIEPVK